MLEKALSFGGWPGLILLFAGNVVGMGAWVACVVTHRYRIALYVSILLFPFSFYAGRAAGISAFQTADFDQRLGLTTFLLLSLFGVLLVAGRIKRARGRLSTWIETFLWVFAIALTVSQMTTHTPFAAIVLSIGAVWQFVALFYLLTSLIVRERDFLGLLNALFLFSLLNIVVRVVAKGESLFVPLSSQTAGSATTFGAEAGRVGSGALGPAVSYAGYLAIFITLALGVYVATRRPIYLAYVVFMFAELLNTFTRGGLFIIALLALLICFRARALLWKIALPAAVVALLTWPVIWRYAAFRGFSLDVVNVSNFALRVDLTRLYLEGYHFRWWGNGILKPTMIELAPWLIVPIHNSYLEILDTCGVITFGAFVVLSVCLIAAAVRASVIRVRGYATRRPAVLLAPFVLVALMQWIVFANTTSTSILAYYPYEGTAVFWMVALMPVLMLQMRRRSVLAGRFRSHIKVRHRFAAISTRSPQIQQSAPAGHVTTFD